MRGPLPCRCPALVLSAVCFAALTCLWPGGARADVDLAFGTRWDPLRYTTAAFPFANQISNNSATLNTVTPQQLYGNSGFQTTSLNPYIGVFFAHKYGLLLSIDLGYGKLSQDIPGGTASMMTSTADNNSFFQFGFALGYKMYLNQPRKERISPYLYIDFFKYFASISTTTMGTDQTAPFIAALLSPIGGTLSFGAEYFVTPGFSIGSEVFGLQLASVSGDYTDSNMLQHSTSYTYVSFFTGLTLNYRFQTQTTVNVSQENEAEAEAEAEARRKKQKTAPAPANDDKPTAPVPPPPSPEAVD